MGRDNDGEATSGSEGSVSVGHIRERLLSTGEDVDAQCSRVMFLPWIDSARSVREAR